MKARLILTKRCTRGCSYCVTQHSPLIKEARTISSADALRDYEEITITGGEPLLEEDRLLRLLYDLQLQKKEERKLYLYTARWVPGIGNFLMFMDGITYTLHAGMAKTMMGHFYNIQVHLAMVDYPTTGALTSRRLRIMGNFSEQILVYPSAWTEIAKVPIAKPEECELPEGEELLVWEEE